MSTAQPCIPGLLPAQEEATRAETSPGKTMRCPGCGNEDAAFNVMPEGHPHYAEVRCPACRQHRWLARPRSAHDVIRCPFTIVVDSREQQPYTFDRLRADADQGHARLEVPIMRIGLPVGHYSILGLPGVCIERKSKEDLYSSIGQLRDNFEARLRRMIAEKRYSAIVVEAQMDELTNDPPRFSQLAPKALNRTIQAWSERYWVQWWFCPGRDWAEAWTFRLLERFWKDHKDDPDAAMGGIVR